MSRKAFFIGFTIILTLSFLIFPPLTYAEQYYLHYPGTVFTARNEDAAYIKGTTYCQLYHNDTNDEYYYCPVDFNVPDGSVHFIKSLSIRNLDNLTDGRLFVELRRCNIFNSAYHPVAAWSGSTAIANPSTVNVNVASNPGFKLIDTKKFTYYLIVKFERDGDLNPGASLKLYQIRIHYGT